MSDFEADLLYGFQEFYNAHDGEEARRVLGRCPSLLTDEGLALLRRKQEESQDSFTRDAIATARNVLTRYRQHWTDEARMPDATPVVFASRVQHIRRLMAIFSEDANSSNALSGAIAAWQDIIADPNFADAPLNFRLAALKNAGDACLRLHQLTFAPDDVNRALSFAEAAVNALPPHWPGRSIHVNFLATVLIARYTTAHDAADIECAIQLEEQLIADPPADPRDLSDCWSNLGHALMERYQHIPLRADLERAIHAYSQAMNESRPESQNRPKYAANLADALRELYVQTDDARALAAVIDVCERVLTNPAIKPEQRQLLAGNLANALLDRYEASGGAAKGDLERATTLLRDLAESTPPGSLHFPAILNNLVGALLLDSGPNRQTMLESSARLVDEAIARAPNFAPERLAYLYNAGNLFAERYRESKRVEHLERSLGYRELALSQLNATFGLVPVDYKLGQQHKWTNLPRQLVLAYLELADIDLSKAAAARQRAMAIAEAAKSRLLKDALNRMDLGAPRIRSKELIREQELVTRLAALETQELASLGGSASPGRFDRVQQRREYRQQLESLWATLAKQGRDGQDYVKVQRGEETAWADLAAIVDNIGPDSVVMSHLIAGDRTLMFVLRAGWPSPQVIGIDVDESAGSSMLHRLFEQTYTPPDAAASPQTWFSTLQPLFEKISPWLDRASRVLVVPSGSGYLIPWAVVADLAAWRTAEGERMPVIVLPTLALLPQLRRRTLRKPGRALVVGDPREDMTHGADEAREVGRMLRVRPLIGSKATTREVLQRMPRASTIHLATHAFFVPGSPLDSGIRLADRNVTAREIIQLSLNAELVVLSACETARTERIGGDEVASLATAFLHAGARSVLVALWQVAGLAAGDMMIRFHQAWANSPDKSRALTTAVEESRGQGWAHPYYWGAFELVGDWLGRSPTAVPRS